MIENLTQKIQIECSKYFLNTFSLKVPNDWLNQCIEFILEENQDRQMNEYKDLVYHQLIDFDLNEIGTNCSNNFLSSPSQPKGFIEGTFLFQINVCIDISQSYFSRIQKLIGDENDNVNVDADNVPSATQFERKDLKKTRLLALFLNDGTHSFKAMETKPITVLNEDILPGTKIQLKGKIPFTNNVLLVGPEHVKLIGGNVQECTTPDNLVELLRKELEVKRTDERSISEREISTKYKATYPVKSTNSNGVKKEQSSQYVVKSEVVSQQQTYKPIKTESKLKQLSLDDEDEDDLLANCDMVSIEKNACSPAVVKTTSNIKRQQSIDQISKYQENKKLKSNHQNSDEEDIYLMQNIVEVKPQPVKAVVKPVQIKVEKQKEIILNEEDDDDDFNQFIMTADVKPPPNDMNSFKDLINATKLEQCCLKNRPESSSMSSLSTCVHIKKCFFKSLVGKIQQSKLKWYQECLISDGNIHMECYIGDAPLAEYLELTCQQAKLLYKQAQEELKQSSTSRSREHFDSCRKKCELILESIKSCVVHLKYDLDRNKFCVFKIEDIKK